jgi:hypothetical protein
MIETRSHDREPCHVGRGSGVQDALLPVWNVNAGFKYFKEFANQSTFQGYSVQFAFAVQF